MTFYAKKNFSEEMQHFTDEIKKHFWKDDTLLPRSTRGKGTTLLRALPLTQN